MAHTAIDKYQSLERTLDRELSKYPSMLQLERRAGIKKTNIVLLAAGALLLLLLTTWMPAVTLALVAYVYPALATISALEGGDRQATAGCLTYWLVLGGALCVRTMTGDLLARVLPFWNLVRLVALFWLFLPQTAGAMAVYERAIRPVVLAMRDHPTVKEASRQLGRNLGKATGEAKGAAKEAVRGAAQRVESTAQEVKSSLRGNSSGGSSKLGLADDDNNNDNDKKED